MASASREIILKGRDSDMQNKSETQSTTNPVTQPRRAVKLNAETLRALEVQETNPRMPALTLTVCNCDPTGPQ